MMNSLFIRRTCPSALFFILLLLILPGKIVPERDEFMEPVDGGIDDYSVLPSSVSSSASPPSSSSIRIPHHNNNNHNKPLHPTNIPLSTTVDEVIMSADTDIPDIDVYKEQIMRRIHNSNTGGSSSSSSVSSGTTTINNNENGNDGLSATLSEEEQAILHTTSSSSSLSSSSSSSVSGSSTVPGTGTSSLATGSTGTVISSSSSSSSSTFSSSSSSSTLTTHGNPTTSTTNGIGQPTIPTGTAVPPTHHPTTTFIPEIEIDKDNPVVETVSDNEVDPLKQHRTNFAAEAAGAVIMGTNPEMKGVHHLLVTEGDSYALAPCESKKWAIVGLSEDVLVDTIVISNDEKYSSSVQNFRVVGSQKYPATEWVVLGNFTAENRLGEQIFPVPVRSWVRYLKFSWLSHYGNEFYCTWTRIRVHGSTILEDLQVHMLNSEAQVSIAKAQIERQSNVAVTGGNVQIVPNTNNPVSSIVVNHGGPTITHDGTNNNEQDLSMMNNGNDNSNDNLGSSETMVTNKSNEESGLNSSIIDSINEEKKYIDIPNGTGESNTTNLTPSPGIGSHGTLSAPNVTEEILPNNEIIESPTNPISTISTADISVNLSVHNVTVDEKDTSQYGGIAEISTNDAPEISEKILTESFENLTYSSTISTVGTPDLNSTNTSVNTATYCHKFSESALAAVAEMLSYLNISLPADKLDSLDEVDREMTALQCLADELLLLQQQLSDNSNDGSSILSSSGTVSRNITVRPECISTLDFTASSLLLASNISDNLHTILIKDIVENNHRNNQSITNEINEHSSSLDAESLPSPSIIPSTLPLASSSPVHANKETALSNGGDPYVNTESELNNVNSLGILSRKTATSSFNSPLSRSNPATANVFKALSMRLSDLEIDASVIHSYLSDMHTRYSGALSSMAKQVESLRSNVQNVRNMSFGVQYSTTVDNLVDTLNNVQQHIDNVEQRQSIIEKILIKFLVYLHVPLPSDIIEDIKSLQPDNNETHWIELIENNDNQTFITQPSSNKFLPSPWSYDDDGEGNLTSTDKPTNTTEGITDDESKSLSLLNDTVVSNETSTLSKKDTLFVTSLGIETDELLTVIEPILRSLENNSNINITTAPPELITTVATGPIATFIPHSENNDLDNPTGWMGSLYRIYVLLFVPNTAVPSTTTATTTTPTASSSSIVNETIITNALQSIHRLEQELDSSRKLTLVAITIALVSIGTTVIVTCISVWTVRSQLGQLQGMLLKNTITNAGSGTGKGGKLSLSDNSNESSTLNTNHNDIDPRIEKDDFISTTTVLDPSNRTPVEVPSLPFVQHTTSEGQKRASISPSLPTNPVLSSFLVTPNTQSE